MAFQLFSCHINYSMRENPDDMYEYHSSETSMSTSHFKPNVVEDTHST